jgi:VWFA-related protein
MNVIEHRPFARPDIRGQFRFARTVGFICLLALGTKGALSFPVPRHGQEPTRPLQYEVSVVLKLIHVYVTDKKGKPVEDLSLADFAATDNGKSVVLTDFEKHILRPAPAGSAPVKEAVTQVHPATRKFFLFFDFAYNNARGIMKARKAALHFLAAQIRPEDEVSILTYSMIKGVAVHEFLTKDHERIREVVAAIGQKDIAGRAQDLEQQYWIQAQEPLAAGREGTGAAQSELIQKIAEAQRIESKRVAQTFIERLTVLAKAVRLIPGQKQFVFFSSGIPNSIIYGGQAGNPSGQGGRSKFDAGDRTLRTLNEEMYKEFGAASCVFFAFDTRESAKEANLFAYDAYTFETEGRGLFGNQGVFQDSTDVFRDDKTTGLNSLKRLTDTTGGKYYSNINMYERNLDQVQALTGTYYVLGYYVGERGDGRFHDIKVEVKRKDCEVRAQSGYFSPKPYREFTRLEKQLHLYDLALNERSLARLPVNFSMTALSYETEEGRAVEILANIPGEVTNRFSGERIEYVAIVFDAKGDIRDVRRVETDPRPHRGKLVVFASGTSLEPGDYTCRLVIRDMETGLSAVSSVRTSVQAIPDLGLRLGKPLLLKDETGCTYLDGGSAKARTTIPWGEIYAFDRTLLAPVAGPVSRLTPRLTVVVPYAVPGTVEPDVVLSASLISAAGGEALPVAFTLVGRSLHSAAETISLEFRLSGLAPGAYILYIYAEDRVSKTRAHAQSTLVISED